MINNKNLNRITFGLMVISIALCILIVYLAGNNTNAKTSEYEEKIFGQDIIDINIEVDKDDWQNLLDNATSKEYISGDLIINGEKFSTVGIRTKGNSSLTQVASMEESDRYSLQFKANKFIKGQSFYGLDTFCINNIIGDNTYMKDYIAYDLMKFIGVDTPLTNYANVKVNGKDFGFYIALERYDKSFLDRVYSTSAGELYNVKMSMGQMDEPGQKQGIEKSKGENSENKEINNTKEANSTKEAKVEANSTKNKTKHTIKKDSSKDTNNTKEKSTNNSEKLVSSTSAIEVNDLNSEGTNTENIEKASNTDTKKIIINDNKELKDDNSKKIVTADKKEVTNIDNKEINTETKEVNFEAKDMTKDNTEEGRGNFNKGDNPGGMGDHGGGSLVYTDDEISSYTSILDNAVFSKNSDKDKEKVIKAIKNLNEGKDLEKYIDVDKALRYLAAHTALVNLDSYSSNMAQNYYLYEKDGKLTVLPWDYNYSFGAFQSGSSTDVINFPIDTPVSGVSMEERPLINKLLEVDEYKEKYHKYLLEIVNDYFLSGVFEEKINALNEKIKEYVEKDPSSFTTYEKYKASLPVLVELGNLRAQSIKGQLDGTIPSTSEGQKENPDSLIDGSSINLSDLGGMGGGRGKEGDNPVNPPEEDGNLPPDIPEDFKNNITKEEMAPDVENEEFSKEEDKTSESKESSNTEDKTSESKESSNTEDKTSESKDSLNTEDKTLESKEFSNTEDKTSESKESSNTEDKTSESKESLNTEDKISESKESLNTEDKTLKSKKSLNTGDNSRPEKNTNHDLRKSSDKLEMSTSEKKEKLAIIVFSSVLFLLVFLYIIKGKKNY